MSIPIGYDSEVGSSITLLGTGLITLQSTPEPESILEPRSSRNEGTKLSRRLSTIERDTIEHTGTVREVYQTDKSGEGSPQDQ
jgi:hypothetical protein